MDTDNVLYNIKPWCHGIHHGRNLSQNLFTIKGTLQQSLMRALNLQPVRALSTVSVDGPIRVDNVDHHVRATSEMIVPIQTVIEPAEEEEEEEEEQETTKSRHGFHEEPLKICGHHHHCRDICKDGQDDEDVAEELEDEEDCDEEENYEDEEEDECDEDEEEDDEIEEEFCISIMDCVPVNRQCRSQPTELQSKSKCPQISPCRNVPQNPQSDKPEKKDKNDKNEQNNEQKETKNECAPEDDDDDDDEEDNECDELHQECTNISKDALLKICKKYKLYDEQNRVNRTKSETEDADDKPRGTAKKSKSKKKYTTKMEEEDESKEEETDDEKHNNAKYLCDDEEPEDDEHKYYGLERPCKAAPVVFDEKAKKINECLDDQERDYSRYDEGVPDDENIDIFYKTNPKYSPVTRVSGQRSQKKKSNQVDSKNNNRNSVWLSNKSGIVSSCTSRLELDEEVGYYEEKHEKERETTMRSKTTENKSKIEKVNKVTDKASYFEYICNDEKGIKKVNKTPKKFLDNEYYAPNCNNNNPIDVTEEQGDYYEHDGEGKNPGDPGEIGYAEINDRGDYTGFCFGKNEDDVCDKVEGDTGSAMEGSECQFKKRSNRGSPQKEMYRKDNEPSCTTVSATGECYPCTVKNQLKYQAYDHGCVHKSVDNYFIPSAIKSCVPLGKDDYHTTLTRESTTAGILFNNAEPIRFNNAESIMFNNAKPIMFNNIEPNFLSFNTDGIAQPIETLDSVAAPFDTEVGLALTSINFEHYKRVFESMKQRAFEEDFEDYFEACGPDNKEEENPKPSITSVEKPVIVSGVSTTDDNLDKKNNSKQGGFLKNLLGIITKSSKKKIQKAVRTSCIENQLNSTDTSSDKIKLSEKKYFNFGRYKVKNSEKLMTIDDLMTVKKLKSKCDRKPKLRLGKPVVESVRSELLDSAVRNVGVNTTDIINIPVASIANSNISKVDVLEVKNSKEDEMQIKNVDYKSGKVAVDDGICEKNSSLKVGTANAALGCGSQETPKSTVAGKSRAFKEDVNKQEADELSTAKKTRGRPRGVVFSATVEETTSAEYESKNAKLVNNEHVPNHSKLTDEADKGSIVCSLYEICENVNNPGGDMSPAKIVYQNSHPVDLAVIGHDNNNKYHILPEPEILNALKCLTSEVVSLSNAPENAQTGGHKYDTSTVQEAVVAENPQKSATKVNTNPVHNVDKTNTTIQSKVQTIGKEDQKIKKSSTPKQPRLKSEDDLANTVKRSVSNYGKKIESNANFIKNIITDSVLSLKTSNITQASIPTSSLTENSLTSSNLVQSDRKNSTFVNNKGKSLKSEGNSNRPLTENVCRHESDLNIAKIASKNKSAKLETKVKLKYPFVKNTPLAEDGSKSDKKRYPFCKSGLCDSSNSSKTIKKSKKNSSTLLLDQNSAFKEKSKAPTKCKSFTQLRELGGCNPPRNVSSKKQASAISASVYDNDNQNANCDDEDDPTTYMPHNVSNIVFPDNQKPLQNIRDMVGLSGITEAQTMSTQEGTGSKLVMESFMLDGSMDSEMTSNLVSYEHPSFRNNAVCRLDDVHDRLTPQTDLLIQNAHDEITRNDSCLIKVPEIDTNTAILDSSKIHDVQLKIATSCELNCVQDKCVLSKIEDTNIAADKIDVNRIETPIQKPYIEVAGKLQDGWKGLRESRPLGFDERREASPVTEIVGQKNTRCLWKYGNYEDMQSSSSAKNESVNLGRYAKYNILENNTDTLGDGQKQKYTSYGLLSGNDRNNERLGQEVQLFFGGSYTAPAKYSQTAQDEERARSGYMSGEKGYNRFSSAALYTTGDTVAPKDTAKSDYLENKPPLMHMNFGANWSAQEGNPDTENVKVANYTEGNALHSHPKISGRPFKSNDDYFEQMSGASKDTEVKVNTAYAAAWKISDANKCIVEEVSDTQFWSRNYSSPLSKDVRICKMADAILKAEKTQDTDCWSSRLYSPGSGSGVAWKRDDTLVDMKFTEINQKASFRTPTNSPERRGEKCLTLNETVSQDKDEKRGRGGSPNTAASGEGSPWVSGVSILQKKATEIQIEESLISNSGNGGTTSKSVGQGDHQVETTVGNDGWGNKSKYLSTRSPPLVFASRAYDPKAHGKGSARDVTWDSAEVKDKQKENNNTWNTIGKSEVNREDSCINRTNSKQFFHREMLSTTRRDKMENEPVKKGKETYSPKLGSKWEGNNKHVYPSNSARTADALHGNKEGLTNKDKAEALTTGRKSSSPTNRINTTGRQAQGIALNMSKTGQEQSAKQTLKINQNSAKKEKTAKHARREEKDVNTVKDSGEEVSREMKGLLSFKVINKGDSSSRQSLLIVPSVSQSGTEPNTEQSRNKKHKSLHEDVTAARRSAGANGSKDIRRSESSNRIGYTSSAGKHRTDNNAEHNLKRKESNAKIFTDSMDMSRSSGKGEFSVRQGNLPGQNMAKTAADHINGQLQAEKESQLRDKLKTREFRELTSPRRSIKNDASDRSSYLVAAPGGKSNISSSERSHFSKDSYSRKDTVHAGNGGQEVMSPRKINQSSRIEYAYNPYTGNRVPGQSTEKDITVRDSSFRKDNTTSETKKTSPSINGNKEARGVRNVDNVSNSGKNKTPQSPSKKDNISRRAKPSGDAVKNEQETIQSKAVNNGEELRSKQGYTVNAEKRKDQSFLMELSRIGKEKIAAIQRRDSSLQMNESRKRKEINKRPSKQINSKKEKAVGDEGGQMSNNTSPTESLKGESRIKQGPATPNVAKWIPDRQLEQAQGKRESNRRFEKRIDEATSQGSETTSPRIKSEAIKRQHYPSSLAEMNDFERRFMAKDGTSNRVERRVGNLRQGVGEQRQGVGEQRQGVGEQRQGVGEQRQGVGEQRQVGDLMQGVRNLSPRFRLKSEFREMHNYLKSPTLGHHFPSHMADHPYLAIENGSRNPNDTRDAGYNEHETSPTKNSRTNIITRHRNIEQKSEQSSAEQESDRTDKKQSKEWNLRQEPASKLHMKSKLNEKDTASSNWSISHSKADQTHTGKEGYGMLDKNVDDIARQKQEESPKANINGELQNCRHGPYSVTVKSKITTDHQVENQDVKEDCNSWNEKTSVISGLEAAVSRTKMKSESNYRQNLENKGVSSQRSATPCFTGESETGIEKTEETTMTGNKAPLIFNSHLKCKEDMLFDGASPTEQEQQLATRNDTDQNKTTPGETSLPENESGNLSTDINQDYAGFKTGLPEDLQPQTQQEQSTFDNGVSESTNNNKDVSDWQRRVSSEDLTSTHSKPVHGYIKHQGASRTKQTFTKVMDGTNSDQSGLEVSEFTQQNFKSFTDYSSAKSDNSQKIVNLMDDSIDCVRNANRQFSTDVGVVKNKRTNVDPRGYRSVLKAERTANGEIESSKSVYEKKDADKSGATSSKQSGNKTFLRNNEGGENISKRPDQPPQLNGNGDRKGADSLRNADHNAAESSQNNKPVRMNKTENEDKFADRNRHKTYSNNKRQLASEQEAKEVDSESQFRQFDDKLIKHQSRNSDKTDLERFMIKHGLKALDSPSKKVDNTKSEMNSLQATAEKMQSGDLHKLSNADSKNASKKWKTEIHRKRVRNEADRNSEVDKYDFSSSVDDNCKTGNSNSRQQLHFGEGRNNEELKKKPSEGLGWAVNNGEMNPDKPNADRRNTKQNQQGRFAGKGSVSTNTLWRNEPNDANKKTGPKYEIEATHSTFGEKSARKKSITVKKSQTDTNQADRYIATMIDSSLVDNVARAWMEDAEKMNTDVKMFNPSTMKQTPGTTLMNYTLGLRGGKTSKAQQSPKKTGKDYLDIFPRPTCLTNSKPHEPEEPDLSPMKPTQRGLNRHSAHKQQHEDNVTRDGEFTGNKLTTLDRDGKRERNYFGVKPAKPFYSKLEQLVPQTVSGDSRSYLNHLVAGKSRDFRKQLTKDDCFIYQGHLNNDIDPVESTRAVEKQTARHNRMDWVTSEKSHSARDKRGKEQAFHGVLEERAPMKTNQDGFQRTTTTHAQRIMDQKNLKAASENTHVNKATPDSAKETRPPSKNTRNNKAHEPSHGTKSTSETPKNGKLDNAKLSKSTSDNTKGIKTSETSKDKKTNLEARAHMFSYKVSSKGTRSEVIKSTQRGTQLAINADKDESEFLNQTPQVAPVLETAVDVPKEIVSDTKDEPIRCDSAPESVQLGLFARLLNTLTRSSKAVPAVQTKDPVVKLEQKPEILSKPSLCPNEPMLPETVSGGKEKGGGYIRNKPLSSRSPVMSLRDAKNLRSDYKQNMNCNAHHSVNGASNQESAEQCGAVVETWTTRGEKLNWLPNKTILYGKASTGSSGRAKEWSTSMILAILSLCVGASCTVVWTYCSDSLQPSVYDLRYIKGLFSLGMDTLVNKTYGAKKTVNNGPHKKSA